MRRLGFTRPSIQIVSRPAEVSSDAGAVLLREVLEQLGVIDRLDFSRGMPPGLFVGHTDSGGERVQRHAPGARVVKVFNTVGNGLMFRPQLPGGPPDMFIGGDDADAKATTTALLSAFGWNTIDLGDITMSRHLEPMCLVWVLSAMKGGHWNQAFKLLRG